MKAGVQSGRALCMALAFCGLAAASLPAAAADGLVIPQPMPGGFNFPTPGYVIGQWVDADNQTAITGHGWDIWQAMTQPTGQSSLPVWDTWVSQAQIFGQKAATGAKAAADADALGAVRGQLERGVTLPHLRPLRIPRQFSHTPHGRTALAATASGGSVIVETERFNDATALFVSTPQVTPYGTFKVNNGSSLQAYAAAFPANTSTAARAVHDFPETGMETKPVFGYVKASTPTAVPFWQGTSAINTDNDPTQGYYVQNWNDCVIVDPSNTATTGMTKLSAAPAPGSFFQDPQLSCSSYYAAPIGMFYGFAMTAAQAQGFANPNVAAGDMAVLVAMHVSTKEQDPWTWQTFYWQGSADFVTPEGPGSMTGQPAGLAAPWNAYAMCTAYSQQVNGQMLVCYNPYLETNPGIPSGITSNCMTCHGMAAVYPAGSQSQTPSYPANYDQPVAFDDPALFGNAMKTDFSWSMADQVFD
jgi:hypothetical protein